MRGWTQGEVGECKTESQSLRSLLHTLGGGDGRDTSDTGGLILQWRKEETDRKVIVEFRLEGLRTERRPRRVCRVFLDLWRRQWV